MARFWSVFVVLCLVFCVAPSHALLGVPRRGYCAACIRLLTPLVSRGTDFAEVALDTLVVLYDGCMQGQGQRTKLCERLYLPSADAMAAAQKRIPFVHHFVCFELVQCKVGDVTKEELLIADEEMNRRGACDYCQAFFLSLYRTLTVDLVIKRLGQGLKRSCDVFPYRSASDCERDAKFRYEDVRSISPLTTCRYLDICPPAVT